MHTIIVVGVAFLIGLIAGYSFRSKENAALVAASTEAKKVVSKL